MERHTLTRNGEPDGEPIGVGFYHSLSNVTVNYGCLSTEFPNGMIRRVFLDKDGRAYMTGWFRPEAYGRQAA